MKKIKILLIVLIAIIAVSALKPSTTVVKAKEVYLPNSDVTLYDYALLGSLAYEDVPNDYNYKEKEHLEGCIDILGNLKKDCFYKHFDNETYTRNGSKVQKYVEGLSLRKRGLVTLITASPVEDGPSYYFYNYSDESEATDWKIFRFKTDQCVWNKSALKASNRFDMVTFRRGNDFVISYRGTDFPDVLEWIADAAYATGVHWQASEAYRYAIDAYKAIVKAEPNANIYITGHSLGGYLAQVGAAAIVEYEESIGKTTNSRLAQVAYLNGMGITTFARPIFRKIYKDTKINLCNKIKDEDENNPGGDFTITKAIQNLYFLSTHDRNGDKIKTDIKYNNGSKKTNLNRTTVYGEKSSGRLVLYQVDADPVSNLGAHFGEVISIERAKDSIAYHTENHSVLNDIHNSKTKSYIDAIANLIGTSIKTGVTKFKNTCVAKATSQFIRNLTLVKALDEATDIDLPSTMGSNIKSQVRLAMSKKTFGGIGDILSTITSNNFMTTGINLISSFNISHETDSFVCQRNDLSNVNSSKLDVSINGNGLYLRGNTLYYRSPSTKGTVSAITRDACTRTYTFEGTPVDVNKYTINSYDGNLNITANVNNKVTMRKLSSDGKSYAANGSATLVNKNINKNITEILDSSKPSCSISSTSLSVTHSIFTKKRVTTTITCKDAGKSGLKSATASGKRTSGNALRGKLESCSGSDGIITCTFVDGSLSKGTNTYVINYTATDNVGNTKSDSFTVSVSQK